MKEDFTPVRVSLDDLMDNQEIMVKLRISPRTLQTYRDEGILPYTRIGNKFFYLKQDVERILTHNYQIGKEASHE